MATSTIFAHVKISDPKNAKVLIEALESSEKEPVRRHTEPAFRVLRDTKDIQKLMSKRFSL